MKSKLEIYALAVCFASVVCLVISIAAAGYSVFQIFKPELTMSSFKYEKYMSNDRYWEIKNRNPKIEKPLEIELTKQREQGYFYELESEKRDGIQSLIKCLMFILSSSIALFIHWKIAQKSRTPV